MKKKYLFLIISFHFSGVWGQNTSNNRKVDSLLEAISSLQSPETSFYHKGMFPSQRGKHQMKEDDNVFFTSLIAFTLQNSKTGIRENNRILMDSICNGAIRNYRFYKNQKGMNTFNFWQTNPPKFFPNSNYLSRHSYFNVPDDADCTALIYLTDTSLWNNVSWLKTKLANHANLTTGRVKSTYNKYRDYKAYSTWFGKKMSIEFDICVQANILYFVFENKLKLNENDSATIALIKSLVLSGKYLRNSYFVSPSYKRPPVVLYHLARLLGRFQIDGLNDCREQIKRDIRIQMKKTTHFMDKVILATSLKRMGESPEPVKYPADLEKEMKRFVYFEADLFSPYARPSLKFISKSNVIAKPFYCKAYCLALLLEYETEINN